MAATFRINKTVAQEILVELRFQGVEGYADKKLLEKLSNLHSAKGAEAAVAKLSEENRKVATALIEATRGGAKVEVTEEPVGESVSEEDVVSLTDAEVEEVEDVPSPKEKTVTTTATKPAAKPAPAPAKTPVKPAAPAPKGNQVAKPPVPNKPPTPAPKPAAQPVKAAAEPKAAPKPRAKDPAGSDAFGSKLGTRAARINAVVTETPKKLGVIQEEAKYDKSPSNHLRWMIVNGWAELVKGEGYKLTAKGLAARGIKPKAAKPPAAKPKAAPVKA